MFSSLFTCLDANKIVLLSFFTLKETTYTKVWAKPRPRIQKDYFWLTYEGLAPVELEGQSNFPHVRSKMRRVVMRYLTISRRYSRRLRWLIVAFDARRTLRNLWGSCGRWDTCACQAWRFEIFGYLDGRAGQKNRWLVAVFAAVCALRWPSYNESSSLQKRAKFEAKYIVNHD